MTGSILTDETPPQSASVRRLERHGYRVTCVHPGDAAMGETGPTVFLAKRLGTTTLLAVVDPSGRINNGEEAP